MDSVNFCVLQSYDSVSEAIKVLLGPSTNVLKRMALPRAFLRRPVRVGEVLSLPIDLLNHNGINPEYTGERIEILFRDKRLLVLNKPAGVHCFPLRYSERDNCLSFLRQSGEHRPLDTNLLSHERGLLYRLDFVTSGVLIYVMEEGLLQDLRKNFKDWVRQKCYLAIVQGDFPAEKEGSHGHRLYPSGVKGKMMKVAADGRAGTFLATTRVRKLAHNKSANVSLLAVNILSGIRHQIRCQLSYLGHPILGDELYGGSAERRVYLHAYQYSLEIPAEDGAEAVERHTFTAERASFLGDFFDLDRFIEELGDGARLLDGRHL